MSLITRRSALAAMALSGLMLALPNVAKANTQAFTVATYQKLVESGKPFLIGVHTRWCSTCAAQKRIISSLRQSGEPYSELTILEMDWDEFRGSQIGNDLQIPRRSTLVMFTNGTETGRIIAGTSPASIKALIDKALSQGSLTN